MYTFSFIGSQAIPKKIKVYSFSYKVREHLYTPKDRACAPLEFSRRSILERFRGISGLWVFNVTLGINIAQNPYITGSLGPKALKYESFEGKGKCQVVQGLESGKIYSFVWLSYGVESKVYHKGDVALLVVFQTSKSIFSVGA